MIVIKASMSIMSFRIIIAMIVAGNTSIFGRRLCPTSFRMLSASSLNTDTATVVGSGPAGLCSAIMLAKRGYRNIMLYDKLSEPPSPNAPIWEDLNAERSYNIGINARGKISLQRFDLMSRIEKFAAPVVGRKGWNPNTPIDDPSEMIFDDYDSHSQCIQRDRLTSCLLQEIREKYSDTIKICFNTECVDIKWIEEGTSNEKVQLTLRREESDTPPSIWNEETHFVIGADGTQSAIRSQMEIAGDDFFHKKFEDKNLRVYRTIPLYFPNNNPNWRKDLNYSVRTKYKINLHALPTKEGLYVGVILFHPNDIRMNKIHTADDAKTFFKELFPMFLPYILQKDFEIFASKSPSRLPKFSYAGPVLHKGKSVALVGDSIHTVKPFFGLGVNSAFEDIAVLDQAFDDADNNREKAFQLYTKARAEDTKALVEISSKLDGGFLTFVLPLVLDSILNKLAPKLFSSDSITSLQSATRKFSEIQRRKRIDRVLQCCLGVLLLTSIMNGVKWASKVVIPFLIKKNLFSFVF